MHAAPTNVVVAAKTGQEKSAWLEGMCSYGSVDRRVQLS